MSKESAKGEAGVWLDKAACPICGKPREDQYRPFCSKRCADVDLGRWFSGSYAIPVTEEEDEDGEDAPPARRGQDGDS